jgi:hypothetical protein
VVFKVKALKLSTMLEISMEMNKALKELVDIYNSLGKLEEPKICNINEESRIKAAINFLKVYEVCVRIDEALRDAVMHREEKEIKGSLDRAKILLNNLVDVIKDLNTKEKHILIAYMQSDFPGYVAQLEKVLQKRPSERIWDSEKIVSVATDLSRAVEGMRKTAGRSMLSAATAKEGGSDYFGKLVC